MCPLRDQLLQTTRAFIDLFNREYSPTAVLALRTPACTHYIRPKSLNLELNNEESIASWGGLQWAFRNYRFSLVHGREPIIDEVAHKTSFWVRGTADTVDGPYDIEIMFVLTMTQDGEKIEEIVEFLDSAYVAQWLPKFQDEEFKKTSLEWVGPGR